MIAGPLGFLLYQSALQAGQFVAPVLAVITAVDPLVSIGIAHVWLHETIALRRWASRPGACRWPSCPARIIALAQRTPQAAGRV